MVADGPQAEQGIIDLPLGRRDASRGWWMKVAPEGQKAVTRWRVIGRAAASARHPALAALALEPITGRTHQLRVHCAAMGWPILGDAVYGSAPRTSGPGLHLHARAVTVPLYPKRDPIHVEAPVPEAMRQRLRGSVD